MKLINLTICDMCKIKEYTCEFKNFYYIQFYSNENQEIYLDMYYIKLPETWGIYFKIEFEKYLKDNIWIPRPLGSRVKFLFERLAYICQ